MAKICFVIKDCFKACFYVEIVLSNFFTFPSMLLSILSELLNKFFYSSEKVDLISTYACS